MTLYRAPLPEIGFVLRDVIGAERLMQLPPHAETTVDTIVDLAGQAARLIEGELSPLRYGSDAGCIYGDGAVRTPAGYRDFYRKFVVGGWCGITHRPEHGGAGLPFLLGRIVEEMLCSANIAFALYPALTSGCYEAISHCANDALKAIYLPKLGSGEWTGSMCLTEPQAGSELASIKTRAIPNADGSYRIEGGKIFITSGEHDLSENIVHFVLARLPDAPAGVRGLSTFIVPKYRVSADGSLGPRNAVRCVSIEHKMGMHGSATCTMAFEGANGWLAGHANDGIRNMFVMMNLERIGVGVQGLGLCELATQAAIGYARARRQGKAFNGRNEIIEHPDVRRMLLQMKAMTEGARVMAYETALNVDIARHHPRADARQAAADWVDLTTPLVKAFCTDAAFDLGSLAIQVHGGHGYIKEQGVEQIVRDARILSLYEGTNGIQALDLVRRKLSLHGGRLPQRAFAAIAQSLATATAEENFITMPLAAALAALRAATAQIQRDGNDSGHAAFASADYLRAFALTLLGWNWLRMDRAARCQHADFFASKRVTTEFYATRILPIVPVLCQSVQQSATTMLDLAAEYF